MQMQLGEETFTDLNMLDLITNHPHEIRTSIFNKPQEREKGGDWEWWFTGPSRKWFGIRVQAKVIDIRTDTFRHLHYKPRGSRKHQVDILIESCFTSSIHQQPVPMYCFYTHWSTQGAASNSGNSGCADELFGCSLASALSVRGLRGRGRRTHRNGLTDLRPFMFPWHQLVCDSRIGNVDLPERAFQFWETLMFARDVQAYSDPGVKMLQDGLTADAMGIYSQITLKKSPPTYVSDLMQQVTPNKPPPVSRLVIFDEEN